MGIALLSAGVALLVGGVIRAALLASFRRRKPGEKPTAWIAGPGVVGVRW